MDKEWLNVLRNLVRIPSVSRNEFEVVDYFRTYLKLRNTEFQEVGLNTILESKQNQSGLPTILLNSHLDTVPANAGYTRDPFETGDDSEIIYGLGSNDAGGAFVNLLALFFEFQEKGHAGYNLVFAASIEEEISGKNGIECILPFLNDVQFAIIGEPTDAQISIAEKGLLVLDIEIAGVYGHAAHTLGKNSLVETAKLILEIANWKDPIESKWLGLTKMSPTILHSGTVHNMLPGSTNLTVDIRFHELYTHQQLIDIVEFMIHKLEIQAIVKARSTRLKASSISDEHAIIQSAKACSIPIYGSPTLSDRALLPYPSIKFGPGKSERSHTANEFIYVEELHSTYQIGLNLFNTFFRQ